MRTASSIIAALALIVTACGPSAPTVDTVAGTGAGGSSTSTASASASTSSAGPGGGTGGAGGAGGAAPAPPTDLYVDPKKGDDVNPGTEDAPLKTVKTALSLITKGHTVFLAPGTYNVPPGDASAAEIPDGVTLGSSYLGALFVGEPKQAGLVFHGSGAADDVRLNGFGHAVEATTGTQTLSYCTLMGNEEGVYVYGDAQMTITMSTIEGGDHGLRAGDKASIAMTGGALYGIGAPCMGSTIADVSTLASVTLNGVNVENSAASIELHDSAGMTAKDSTFHANGDIACGTSVFVLEGASTLALENSGLVANHVTAIGGTGGSVTMTGGAVIPGTNAPAILLAGVHAEVDGTHFMSGGTGIGLQVQMGGSADVKNATIEHFNQGISIASGTLKVRGTTFKANEHGVDVSGGSVDLGTFVDHGNNTLTTNADAGLYVSAPSIAIDATGNTWIPAVQDASPIGMYVPGALLFGPYGSSAPAPRNFFLTQAGQEVTR